MLMGGIFSYLSFLLLQKVDLHSELLERKFEQQQLTRAHHLSGGEFNSSGRVRQGRAPHRAPVHRPAVVRGDPAPHRVRDAGKGDDRSLLFLNLLLRPESLRLLCLCLYN